MNQLHYDAFISYRHIDGDMQIAEKLQTLLENHKVHDKETGEKRRLRVFRDESELPTSGDLGSDIYTALECSDFLIIVYSPETRHSKWCMAELRYFKSLHNDTNKNILPIIVSGEPSDVLPDELKYERRETFDEAGNIHTVMVEIEPLCADVRDETPGRRISRLKKKEYMRIAAPILGVPFDTLYQRHRRKAMTRMAVSAGALFTGVFLFGSYNYTMRMQLMDKQNHIVRNESNRIAYLADEQSSDSNLAFTLALTGAELLAPNDVAGSDSERVLKQLLIQEEIAEQRDFFHVDAVIPMNSRFMVGDTYADGTCIELQDFTDTYLFDLENGELLFQYDSMDIYFNADATQYITYSKEANNWTITGYNREEETIFFQDEFEAPEEDSYFQYIYDDNTDNYYIGISNINGFSYLKEVSSAGEGHDITEDELPDAVKEQMAGTDWYEMFNGSQYDYSHQDYVQGKLSGTRKEHFDGWHSYGLYVQGSYLLGDSGLECYAVSANDQGNSLIYYINDNDLDQIVYTTTRNISVLKNSNKFLRYIESGNGIEILSLNKDNVLEKDYEKQSTLKTIYGIRPFIADTYGNNVRIMISPDRTRFLKVEDICTEYVDLSASTSSQNLKKLNSFLGIGYTNYMETAPRYQLTIGDIAGTSSDVFQKIIYGNPHDSRLQGNLALYSTPDMRRVAYVTPEGQLEVIELPAGNVLYSETLDFSDIYPFRYWTIDDRGQLDIIRTSSPNVFVIALDTKGEVLAVAYADQKVILYSIETGEEIQRFSVSEEFDLSWVSCIEFNEQYLLLADSGKTILLPKTAAGTYDSSSAKSFDGGEECYGSPKFMTSDGLLFTTYSIGSDFMLRKIYDIETETAIDFGSGAQNYCYDPSTGYLVWEDDTQTYRTGTKNIAQRQPDGSFELIGKIKPDSYNMQMVSHGAVIDGNLLLLEKAGRTELFDLTTQTRLYAFDCSDLRIKDGILFDTAAFGKGVNATYNMNMTYAELKEKVQAHITSPLGTRTLNDAERRKYYIDESLY